MAPRATAAASHGHHDRHSAEDLVRLEQDHGRPREPEGLRGLEIDDQLVFGRLLHRQGGGCGPLRSLSIEVAARRVKSTRSGAYLMRPPTSTLSLLPNIPAK